jgi:hypothetical protein
MYGAQIFYEEKSSTMLWYRYRDAMWGFSHTKGWKFGYKLHLISSTNGSIIVPLAADFTTAKYQIIRCTVH